MPFDLDNKMIYQICNISQLINHEDAPKDKYITITIRVIIL